MENWAFMRSFDPDYAEFGLKPLKVVGNPGTGYTPIRS